MKWTEEQINTAIALRNAGKSGGEIAEVIGVSRNAVIGKLNRLGHKMANGRAEGRKNGVPVRKPPRVERKAAFVPPGKLQPAANFVIDDTEVTPDKGVKLVDLENHHCRWPYGETDFYFCGRMQVAGSSYCAHHSRRNMRSINATVSDEGQNDEAAARAVLSRTG